MQDRPHAIATSMGSARLEPLEMHRAQDIVATAAHELNEPLTVLIGLVDLMQRYPDLAPSERVEMLEAMSRQAHHLAAVVADVLHVTNGDGSPPPALTPVPLVEVVSEALEVSRHNGDTSVQVSVQGGAMADRDGLLRVLTTLLTNAYRYGGPHVAVSSRVVGGWTALTVADDGQGVPAALRESLFDRYTRGENTGGHQGLGIGLRVARDLVESFGGTLTYEPELPTESRFTIRLRPVPSGASD